MNKEQAIQILKTTLDLAIKSGAISTLGDANAIAIALQVIMNELKDK